MRALLLPLWLTVMAVAVAAAAGPVGHKHPAAAAATASAGWKAAWAARIRTVGQADVYVSPAGSDSNPCSQTQPCATFAHAYQTAGDGATVHVAAGSYPAQEIDRDPAKNTAGPAVVFQPSGPATVASLQLGGESNGCVPDAPSWVTITGLTIPGGIAACPSAHVTVTGNTLCAAAKTLGACAQFKSPSGLVFSRNTLGPSCCGYDGHTGSSPILLRLAVSTGDPNPTDVTVTGNLFRGSARTCAQWSQWFSAYGPCPSVTCPDFTQCHNDTIHAYGCTNCTISRNTVLVYDVQAFYMEEANGGYQYSGAIENNYFGHDIEQAWHAIWFSLGCAANNGQCGTWTIRNNTLTEQNAVDLGSDQKGRWGKATIVYTGNLGGRIYNDGAGCYPSSFTLTYAYNLWAQAVSPWLNDCGKTDSGPYDITGWVDQTGHLTGASAIPVGEVKAGCPAVDIDGDARPVPCAAGDDEPAAAAPPPPPSPSEPDGDEYTPACAPTCDQTIASLQQQVAALTATVQTALADAKRTVTDLGG